MERISAFISQIGSRGGRKKTQTALSIGTHRLDSDPDSGPNKTKRKLNQPIVATANAVATSPRYAEGIKQRPSIRLLHEKVDGDFV